jgi:hypothetical protein
VRLEVGLQGPGDNFPFAIGGAAEMQQHADSQLVQCSLMHDDKQA